jgi:hypothetical protein
VTFCLSVLITSRTKPISASARSKDADCRTTLEQRDRGAGSYEGSLKPTRYSAVQLYKDTQRSIQACTLNAGFT